MLNPQLELLQSRIDALKPGTSRDQLQADLDRAMALIERLPHQIAEAISWQDAYAIGAPKARARLTAAICNALRPPKR